MSSWEYKIISSGKHGMASMATLEQFLNELGQQQWEIINWQTAPDTPLVFSGLARRPILRDWKPEEMPAAQEAAKVVKLEESAEEKERAAWRETMEREAAAFRGVEDESDSPEELFDAIRPLLKRSQRGDGFIGSVGFIARKLEQPEADLIGALKEAGLTLSENPDDTPTAIPYEDEYLWLNKNQRGEVWLNCTSRPPKPRAPLPQKQPLQPRQQPLQEQHARPQAAHPAQPAAPVSLQEGPALLAQLHPMMRRSRRGNGLSGTLAFLSRALHLSDAEFSAALANLGLRLPEDPKGKPIFVEIDNLLYWLNHGQDGKIWINAREKRPGESVSNATENTDASQPQNAAAEQPAPTQATQNAPTNDTPTADEVFGTIRPHFSKNKRGTSFSAAPAALADAIQVSLADLMSALIAHGLIIPETEDDKPTFVENSGDIFWFNRNAKGELWLNAKAKPARKPRVAKPKAAKKSAAE